MKSDGGNRRPVTDQVLEREKEHHDQWAAEIDVRSIRPRELFEASTCPENRFILSKLGEVRGKRLLDLGCGAGESAVYFAMQGAECTATDLSPGMIRTANSLAALHGVSIRGFVMDAGKLDFPDASFDIVYAANLLHHVDPQQTLQEMRRVLKPGGKACFWDPLRHNPVINVYRRIATDVRSADEHPLDYGRTLALARRLFSTVEYDSFWFFTLWIFLRFYLIERVDPNKERYWKKIITDEERLRPIYRRLERLDRWVKRVPFLRRYAWNIAVVATR